jgi:hypothetical protein
VRILGVRETKPVFDENVGAVARVATGANLPTGPNIFACATNPSSLSDVPAGDYVFSIVNESSTND